MSPTINLALGLGFCRCAAMRTKSRRLVPRSYTSAPPHLDMFLHPQHLPCCMGAAHLACLRLHLQDHGLSVAETCWGVQRECYPTTSLDKAGLCSEGRTHKTLPALKNINKAAGRLLLHSSQTGWHPNRHFIPRQLQPGLTTPMLSRLEGSCEGETSVALRGISSCTTQTTHTAARRHQPLMHTTLDTKHTHHSPTHTPRDKTLVHCTNRIAVCCTLQGYKPHQWHTVETGPVC